MENRFNLLFYPQYHIEATVNRQVVVNSDKSLVKLTKWAQDLNAEEFIIRRECINGSVISEPLHIYMRNNGMYNRVK